ncbi:MAG: hypothetical protein JKX85_11920 [Phycisphaeraceae bacterium]|nr:hypothetical protein [Phycisphaeraceae bacterium]
MYYIPNIDKADHAVLAKHGLAYAFADSKSNPTSNSVIGGPDGGNGVVTPGIGVEDARYLKDTQTWRKYKGVWVGYNNDEKPGPSDLIRKDALDGYEVVLGDQNQWVVPLARSLSESDGPASFSCYLPTKIDLDEDGKWIEGATIKKYEHLWPIACGFWDKIRGAVIEDGKIAFDFSGETEFAIIALQANYRIGPMEAVLLELLDAGTAVEILKAMVDWPTFVSWQKKMLDSGAAGIASSDGPEAETLVTDPH